MVNLENVDGCPPLFPLIIVMERNCSENEPDNVNFYINDSFAKDIIISLNWFENALPLYIYIIFFLNCFQLPICCLFL